MKIIYILQQQAILIASAIRGILVRKLDPASNHYKTIETPNPVSRKFGMDRGTPIDRYYIDKFISQNKKFIKGMCLEIGDRRYTKKFGEHVQKSDVLDIVSRNKIANIIGDLRNVKQIQDNTYDCIILTQVMGMIDDCDAAISECHRILKPKGVILITSSSISPQIDYDFSFWRFTIKSLEYLLLKKFNKKNVKVTGFGNAYIGQCLWVGLTQEEIKKEYLDIFDKQFQCIIGAVAYK